MTGIAALRSKWAAGKAVRAGLALRGSIARTYVTEEQRRRRPIFIAIRLGGLPRIGWSGHGRVAHRSKTAAGILPLRLAHPAKLRIGAGPARTAAIPVTDLVHWLFFESAKSASSSQDFPDPVYWVRFLPSWTASAQPVAPPLVALSSQDSTFVSC